MMQLMTAELVWWHGVNGPVRKGPSIRLQMSSKSVAGPPRELRGVRNLSTESAESLIALIGG